MGIAIAYAIANIALLGIFFYETIKWLKIETLCKSYM